MQTANSTVGPDEGWEFSESGGLSRAEVKRRYKASVMAGILQDLDSGTAYYDWASEHYDITPNNVTRGLFLRYLIGNNLDWIGLDRNNRDIKVLDYGAGTGFLSHAFVPHVSKVLAIDNSHGMVSKYNRIAVACKQRYPGCDMRAVHGDLVDVFERREAGDPEISDPHGDFQSFDLVAMCLVIDCIGSCSSSDVQFKELVKALTILAGRLKNDGLLIIVDVDKFYGEEDSVSEALLNCFKEDGHGSKEVVEALNKIGMKDIDVIDNQHLEFGEDFLDEPYHPLHRKYFMVRARKSGAE